MVLGTVAFDAAMEGMTRARDECLNEMRKIERKGDRPTSKVRASQKVR